MWENSECDPLSWHEARFRLRQTLEQYLKEDISRPASTNHSAMRTNSRPFLSNWIRFDLDLYAGSLLLSLTFFVVSCVSWLDRSGTTSLGGFTTQVSTNVCTAQLVASAILLVAAAVSLWVVRSRHRLWLNDSQNAKRRTIRTFLRKIDRCRNTEDKHEMSEAWRQMNLHGTSLTDSYVSFPRLVLSMRISAHHFSSISCFMSISPCIE
jgi:hypothetical protein